MDQQAKKRGRKRKSSNEEIREFVVKPGEIIARETVKPIVAKHNKRHEEEREFIKLKRSELNKKIMSKSEEIQLIMNSKEFRNKVFNRFINKKYSEDILKDNINKKVYDNIYEKIKNKTNTKDEFFIWQESISYKLGKKLSEIAEFILQNGVMSVIDKMLLNDSLEGLYSYYNEKIYFINSEYYEKNYILKTTFLPEKDSAVFNLLFKNNDFLTEDQIEDFLSVNKR